MAKLSYAQLKVLVANIVTEAKLANETFNETKDNIVGLVDKIGKIHTLDTVFAIDKLARFDGEYLSYGKIVEEWQQDLILPTDYDSNGAGALTPSDPTYRPVSYSYTLGRKKVKTTIRNNNIERAVHNEGELSEVISTQIKRISDSMAAYRYQVKREMLGKYINMCINAMDAVGYNFDANTTIPNDVPVNARAEVENFEKPFIVVKQIPANTMTAEQAIAEGYLIELDLVSELAAPTDTTTGEAFIKQVKKDVEIANDLSEGHSLNGNSLGAVPGEGAGLVLVVKQGVIPTLEIDVMASAFHEDKVATPAEVIVVKDFGSAPKEVYAVLMDGRGARLFNTYRAMRENFNGDGDFVNMFDHTEDTAAVSRNTFIKVYKAPQA